MSRHRVSLGAHDQEKQNKTKLVSIFSPYLIRCNNGVCYTGAVSLCLSFYIVVFIMMSLVLIKEKSSQLFSPVEAGCDVSKRRMPGKPGNVTCCGRPKRERLGVQLRGVGGH